MALEQKLKQLQVKINQNPLTSATILISVLLLLLIVIPIADISLRGINNATVEATLENQDRATLAQILGGVAIGIGLYYTWRRVIIAEKDLKVSQEGQITERFTRAVDQLGAIDHFGNPSLEIRLGGIYALERISIESKKDYWPIMEILTAYIRKCSSVEIIRNKRVNNLNMDIQANESIKMMDLEIKNVSLDIQAILTVIKRRQNYFNNGESNIITLQATYLEEAELEGAHLEGANLMEANLRQARLDGAHLEGANLGWVNLEWAFLKGTRLEGASLRESHLEWAFFRDAHLEGAELEWASFRRADLQGANFEGANLKRANFEGADLEEANLEKVDLEEANLEHAYLKGANLKRVKNLTIEQLSTVTTLYNATIDEELLIQLKDKFPSLFEKSDYNPYA
jgi:uncharacterized protein YjbI with pentapeptide repeats